MANNSAANHVPIRQIFGTLPAIVQSGGEKTVEAMRARGFNVTKTIDAQETAARAEADLLET